MLQKVYMSIVTMLSLNNYIHENNMTFMRNHGVAPTFNPPQK